MTIQLNLKPEIEARLIAQAAAKGILVEQYLESWIGTNLKPEIERSLSQTENTEDWFELLEAFCNNPALAKVPPLSDEAISRESIYNLRELASVPEPRIPGLRQGQIWMSEDFNDALLDEF